MYQSDTKTPFCLEYINFFLLNKDFRTSYLTDLISCFTHQKHLFKKKRWHYVGHEDLRSTQTDLDLRVVAGELWKGDVHIGAASDEDRKSLPEMLVVGAGLVEKKATALN